MGHMGWKQTSVSISTQTKDKYEKALKELNQTTSKYTENTEQVFKQCQQFEALALLLRGLYTPHCRCPEGLFAEPAYNIAMEGLKQGRHGGLDAASSKWVWAARETVLVPQLGPAF